MGLLGNSKDAKLMALFITLSQTAKQGLDCLLELFQNFADISERQAKIAAINELEKRGDQLLEEIRTQIADISITSWIAPEQTLGLANQLDRLLDGCRSIVRIMHIHQIDVRPEMIHLAVTVAQCGNKITLIMEKFCQPRWKDHINEMQRLIKEVDQLESVGDRLREEGLTKLWNIGRPNEPLTLTQLSALFGSDKILERLEEITDYAHHLASTVQQNLMS